MKLTVALKEKIADDAARDLFAEPLLKQFSDVQANMENLVRESFSDFDFKNAEPYQEYINWHEEIKIPNIPGDWEITHDEFKRKYKLPSICYFNLPFKIPDRHDYHTPYLDDKYHKRAVEILRPYMINYLTARKAYDDIKQVLLGINTFKQLEESLPELAKYLPIVVNVVTALVPIEQINRIKTLFKRKQEDK